MRSARALEAAVLGVDPGTYPDADTYVRVCLAALGVFVPAGVGARLSAHGFATGWELVDADTAIVQASRGHPVVAVAGSDVALVVPCRLGDEPWIAQGGPAPRTRAPVTAAFGRTVPAYWAHP